MRISCLMLAVAISGCAVHPTTTTRQVAADATEGRFSMTTYEWDGEIAEGGTVSMTNAFGNLRVRGAVEGHVVVSGQIQRFAGDDRDVEVVVVPVSDGLRIVVREIEVPSHKAVAQSERGSNKQFDGRIDMALRLPHSAQLIAKTADGLLQLKGYQGLATLNTGAGKILASTPASVVARSDSGELNIQFRGTSWARMSELSTRTGEITVTVPSDADLVISAKSRGQLSANLDVPISRGRNTLKATLGAGSQRLTIRSESGPIGLLSDGVR